MNVYQIRLTNFEIRLLIGILSEYRKDLLVNKKDTTQINILLLKLLIHIIKNKTSKFSVVIHDAIFFKKYVEGC